MSLPGLIVSRTEGGPELVSRYAAAWEALCDEGPCATITCRPVWVDCYLRAYHPAGRIHLVVAERAGELRGVLPLVEDRFGVGPIALRRFATAADFQTWEIDLVHGEDDRNEVVRAVAGFMCRWKGWDVLQCHTTFDGGGFAEMTSHLRDAGAHVERPVPARSWLMTCPPAGSTRRDAADALPKSKRSRANDLRRLLNRIDGLERVVWRTLDVDADSEALVGALDAHLDIEIAGWKGRSGSPAIRNPSLVAFLRNLVLAQRLVIHELWLDGMLAASQLGVADGERFILLRMTYDESFRSISPGSLLWLEVLRDAANRGCVTCDMGGDPGEAAGSYKSTWTESWHSVSAWTVFAPGPRGRAVRTLWFRLRPGFIAIRDRLRGWKRLAIEGGRFAPLKSPGSRHQQEPTRRRTGSARGAAAPR